MKTLFALLGLFMFASVSSSDLSVNSTSENGDGSATTMGAKRALVIQMSENGDGSATTMGAKRALVIQ